MDLMDEYARPTRNRSPAVVKGGVENPLNRRCLKGLPLDRPQRGRGLVAGRGASSRQNGRQADPVPLLPFTDGSAGGTAEQFVALVSPRHNNGLYSTGHESGRLVLTPERDFVRSGAAGGLSRQLLRPRARELMMPFESLTTAEDVSAN